MKKETLKKIDAHLKKARKKHKEFFKYYITEVLAIAGEEFGEWCKEVNTYFYGSNKEFTKHRKLAKEEALDLIAVLIRYLEEC